MVSGGLVWDIENHGRRGREPAKAGMTATATHMREQRRDDGGSESDAQGDSVQWHDWLERGIGGGIIAWGI